MERERARLADAERRSRELQMRLDAIGKARRPGPAALPFQCSVFTGLRHRLVYAYLHNPFVETASLAASMWRSVCLTMLRISGMQALSPTPWGTHCWR